MRVLNVAEKPSVARAVAAALSHNRARRTHQNPDLPLLEFPYTLDIAGQRGAQVTMAVGAVRGHLFETDFASPRHQKWRGASPRVSSSA